MKEKNRRDSTKSVHLIKVINPMKKRKKRHTFPISGMKTEHLRSYRFFFFKIIGILKLVYVNRFEI